MKEPPSTNDHNTHFVQIEFGSTRERASTDGTSVHCARRPTDTVNEWIFVHKFFLLIEANIFVKVK